MSNNSRTMIRTVESMDELLGRRTLFATFKRNSHVEIMFLAAFRAIKTALLAFIFRAPTLLREATALQAEAAHERLATSDVKARAVFSAISYGFGVPIGAILRRGSSFGL